MKSSTLKIAAICVAALAALAAVISELFLTTPKRLGPNGVTFWFISLLVALVCLLAVIFIVVKTRYFNGRTNMNRTVNSSFRTAFLLGIGAVTILALSTLGTLSIKDVVLLGLVVILIEFYLRTRKPAND